MEANRIINLSFQIWGMITTLILLICMYQLRQKDRKEDRLFCQILLLNIAVMGMDALALFFRGKAGVIAFVGMRATNYLQFTFSIISGAVEILFLIAHVQGKCRKKVNPTYRRLVGGFAILSLCMLTINLFVPFLYDFGENQMYRRLPGFNIIFIYFLFCLVINAYILILYRKKFNLQENIIFILYAIMPIVGGILSILFGGIVFHQMGNTFVCIFMFLYFQYVKGHQLERQNKELAEMKLTMVINQIRPHFIFNALNSIEYLCYVDGEAAAEAINHFAAYLRENMNNLTKQELVPFTKEKEHVDDYLYIEHLRFPHIQVEYDLSCTEFQLPALTLQPIIENAIKHGVRRKGAGSKIIVRTYEEKDMIVISIEDNGVGFDTSSIGQLDSGQHVGISNTRKRLEYMCGGSLEIESAIGKGTTVRMRIPEQHSSDLSLSDRT